MISYYFFVLLINTLYERIYKQIKKIKFENNKKNNHKLKEEKCFFSSCFL